MTLTALLENFRTSLLAILPSVERVGIPWHRPYAYDDWDSLASTLYQRLVADIVRWGIPEHLRDDFDIPPYDLILDSYRDLSLVEIVSAGHQDQIRIFHSLGTEKEPFDMVEMRIISPNGTPLSDDFEIQPFQASHFRLRVRAKNREPILLEEVDLGKRLRSSG